MSEKKYTGYGYHGGGRQPKAPEKRHRTNVTICGTLEEISRLKALAKEAGKSTSRYVLDIILPESPIACICGGPTVVTGQDTTATYYRCKDCGKTYELKNTAVCEFIEEQCRKIAKGVADKWHRMHGETD